MPLSTFPQSLAGFVRASRRKNKLTQEQLAEHAGVGSRFVSDLESAKPTVRIDKVDAVLRIFGRGLGIVQHVNGGKEEWADAEEGCSLISSRAAPKRARQE